MTLFWAEGILLVEKAFFWESVSLLCKEKPIFPIKKVDFFNFFAHLNARNSL